MTHLRIVKLIIALTLLTGGLAVWPAPLQATPTTYDCATATGLPQDECEALVAIYHSTNGDDWWNKSGWLQTTTPCSWHGVTCTAERVSGLNLYHNHLIGTLPPEIGNLTALEVLALSYNILTTLPPEIGNLTVLEELYLNNNALTALPPRVRQPRRLEES